MNKNKRLAKTPNKTPFWLKPMRIMDLALEDSHGSWVNRWTPEWAVETALKLNANVLNLMIVNEWGQAYWQSPHLPMQPELDGEDRFGAVAKLAKKSGLYVSGMWGPTLAPVQSQRHPDWASRSRNGEKLGWGLIKDDMCFDICMNSPYEDLVNKTLDQLFSDYPIDMLALDCYRIEPCWCEYCRERCLEDTGLDIFSEKIPYGKENFHKKWQANRGRQQIQRISETISNHDGVLVTYHMEPGVDVIFHEPHTGDMLDLRDKGYMIRRDTAKARATGRSVVTCTPYANQYYIGWSKPPVHMRQEFRVMGIHGSSPWPVMWDWEILRDPRGLKPLGTVFSEMKSVSDLMSDARPMRHVALVYSADQARGTKHQIEHGDAVKGYHDALSRAHVPFEIITKDLLTSDMLQEYSTLILPNVWSLDEKHLDAIMHFVSSGGSLVSTYKTSKYTQEGWDRYEFGLHKLFGVSYLGEVESPWCYITPRGNHPVFSHIENNIDIPHGDINYLKLKYMNENNKSVPQPVTGNAGIESVYSIGTSIEKVAGDSGTHVKVEEFGETEVIAGIQDTRKSLGSYFQKDVVPAIPGRETGYPSVVVNKYGKGRSIYFGGQPDQLFNRQGHPDYEQLLVNTVNWISSKPDVYVDAPNTVEVTYWELASGSYIVHLLNHTYDAMFPAPGSASKVPASREVFRPITQVIPIQNIKIELNIKLNSAALLVGESELNLSGNTVEIAELGEYAVVKVN